MGWFISQSVPDLVSLKVADAGGDAWVMGAGRGGGATPMRGKDQGDDPFIRIHDAPESGYHGTLYVGRISAAKPALAQTGG